MTIDPNLPGSHFTGRSVQPHELASATRDFEALLLSQILKSATQSSPDGGWFGTGEDEAGQQALSLAQEQFAQALASRGGLGLSERIILPLLMQGSGKNAEAPPTSPRLPVERLHSE